MAMQLFTNCRTCCFYDGTCTLGKWESPGFKNHITDNEEFSQINGRICPFHRVQAWYTDDYEEKLRKECSPNYGLIFRTHGAGQHTIDQIDQVMKWKFVPKNIYIIDYGNLNKDVPKVRVRLKDFGSTSRIKSVLNQDLDPDYYVDEYVMLEKIQEPFYLYCDDLNKEDPEKLLDKVYDVIFNEMNQLLWAGNDRCQFVVKDLHQTVKVGHKLYLKEEGLGHLVYEMDTAKC